MKPHTIFDIAYLVTNLFGNAGYKMRFGLGIVRNMYYLLRK